MWHALCMIILGYDHSWVWSFLGREYWFSIINVVTLWGVSFDISPCESDDKGMITIPPYIPPLNWIQTHELQRLISWHLTEILIFFSWKTFLILMQHQDQVFSKIILITYVSVILMKCQCSLWACIIFLWHQAELLYQVSILLHHPNFKHVCICSRTINTDEQRFELTCYSSLLPGSILCWDEYSSIMSIIWECCTQYPKVDKIDKLRFWFFAASSWGENWSVSHL